MTQRSRSKTKGRLESGTFTQLPLAVQESANWALCSGASIKLLLTLFSQYKGTNNGDLCAALSVLKQKGWTRGETISNSLRELIHYGLIEMTRQGGLHRASLFAVTWKPIDYCKGKLDVKATNVASGLWKENKVRYMRANKKLPSRKAA